MGGRQTRDPATMPAMGWGAGYLRRALFNAQIAAGYALTLRLRAIIMEHHGGLFDKDDQRRKKGAADCTAAQAVAAALLASGMGNTATASAPRPIHS
jgi:hypothetical protein